MSNQHDQDRDRIAEAMKWEKYEASNGLTVWQRGSIMDGTYEQKPPGVHPVPPTLDAAIAAFETLCEPKGWKWARYPSGQWAATHLGQESAFVPPTGNHAADVCRLVCMVLDREAARSEADSGQAG